MEKQGTQWNTFWHRCLPSQEPISTLSQKPLSTQKYKFESHKNQWTYTIKWPMKTCHLLSLSGIQPETTGGKEKKFGNTSAWTFNVYWQEGKGFFFKKRTICSKRVEERRECFAAISPLILWDLQNLKPVGTTDFVGSRGKYTEHLLALPFRASCKVPAKEPMSLLPPSQLSPAHFTCCGYSYYCPTRFSVPWFSYSSTSVAAQQIPSLLPSNPKLHHGMKTT